MSLGAALFNGANYLAFPNPPQLSPGANPFSVTCWVKFNAITTATQPILGKWRSAPPWMGSQKEWLLTLVPAFGFRFNLSGDGYNNDGPTGAPPGGVLANVWYQLLGVFTPTGQQLYINGALADSRSEWPSLYRGTADFQIGALTIDSGTAQVPNIALRGVTGSVGRVGCWSRALSAGDATTLYNGGASLSYATLPAGLLTGLVAWWDLGEPAGTTRLNATANNLGDHNAVGFDPAGPPS